MTKTFNQKRKKRVNVVLSIPALERIDAMTNNARKIRPFDPEINRSSILDELILSKESRSDSIRRKIAVLQSDLEEAQKDLEFSLEDQEAREQLLLKKSLGQRN